MKAYKCSPWRGEQHNPPCPLTWGQMGGHTLFLPPLPLQSYGA